MALDFPIVATPLAFHLSAFALFNLHSANAEQLLAKSIALIIGYATDSWHDASGRLLARRLSARLPGRPAMMPKNMKGAGSPTRQLSPRRCSPYWNQTGMTVGLPYSALLKHEGARSAPRD